MPRRKEPVNYTCDDIRRRGLGDPLGSCEDFSPSYDVQAGRDVGPLLAALTALIGPLPPNAMELTLDRELGLEEEDLPSLVAEAGGDLGNVDLSLLLAQGTLANLVPFLPLGDRKKAYKARVRKCAQLKDDDVEFGAEGCKRKGHLVLPRGRLSFIEPGTYRPRDPQRFAEKEPYSEHPVTPATTERHLRAEPPLDARTQSQRVHALTRERSTSARVARMTQAIIQGLMDYGTAQGGASSPYVVIPQRPEPMIAAGVPEAAAVALARGSTRRVLKGHPQLSIEMRLFSLFGSVPLIIGRVDTPDRAYFDLAVGSLKSLRGPLRALNKRTPATAFSPAREGLLTRIKGSARPKRRAKRAMQQRLVITRAWVERPGSPKFLLNIRSLDDFYPQLERATRKGTDWTIVFEVVPPFDRTEKHLLRLQHSNLFSPQGSPLLPDYTTLRGLSLPELAHTLAQRLTQPRKRRRGRRQPPSHSSAKKNPVATYTLSQAVADRVQPGDWLPLTLGARVDVDNPANSVGKVVYRSKKPGAEPKVWSARRVAAFMNIARHGHALSEEVKGQDAKDLIPGLVRAAEESVSATSNPRSRQRKNPMAKHRDYLSTDSVLNRRSNWYDPGTVWDYYEAGEFPAAESVPVNRRNPRRAKKNSGRARTNASSAHRANAARAMQIKNQQGVSLKEAWAIVKGRSNPRRSRRNPRTYKSHSTSVHQYRSASHKANAAEAMRLKHDNGISLKEAWAIVKGGRAAANPRAGAYWPRNSVYELADGPFGSTFPLPVNRRNPRRARRNAGKTFIGRFPSPCKVCGESMKGHEIVQVGVGPKGGKQMAHKNCS